MAACSPQRFLPNSRNLFALSAAVIAATSVRAVENQVTQVKTARDGTAQARLTGTYTGQEAATYEFQILDTDVEVARVSAPTFSGKGSGTLSAIAATGVQQVITLECADAGIEGAQASISIAGQKIVARISGTAGNAYRISVDQSGLTFADSGITTLADLQAGQGGSDSPLTGPGSDWGHAALDGNGLIPGSAPRLAFGDDESSVHLAYKDFVDSEWRYYLIPALVRAVPKGTPIKTVTGGRTVSISDGAMVTDVFPDIETNYDLLSAIRAGSALVDVVGIVANDRSPTGQAARELSLRTDAHAQVSTGTGSSYAKGLENVTVASDAGQQLVTLECFATSSNDHPNARLGHELWQLKSSLLGDLGIIATGERFSNAAFGFTIPVRLPPGYGAPKGKFSAAISYATRGEGESEPPICPVAPTLGSDPVDGTYTFVYSARPSGDCDCTGMPVPRLNSSCLGTPTEGGGSVDYQPDTIEELVDLHTWFAATAELLTALPDAGGNSYAGEAPALTNPLDPPATQSSSIAGPFSAAQATQSLKEVVASFEATLAEIDPLTPASPPAYREAGFTAWIAARDAFKADIDAAIGASSPILNLLNIPSDRYAAALNLALISAGIATVGKTDASTVSGDGCWRDWGDAAYWVNTDGDLLPMFTNHPYIASRLFNGRAFSVHNFGLQLNVDCPEDLEIGDTVTLTISNSSVGATYQQGDIIELPIVAAAPLFLTGGVTANPVQTWNVNSDVKGPFPAYAFNPDSPAAYSETVDGSTIGFLLNKGGIANAKGDRYRFAIEGGHYQWRKNGGAWDATSPPLPIPVGSDLIDSGLSVSWTAGAASSFVADDVYEFRARQPWAVSNTLTPNPARRLKWDGPDVEYTADFGSVQTFDLFAMLHDLPDDAEVVLSWGVAAHDEADEELTWRRDVIRSAETTRTARYAKIAITNAEDGAIIWPWIGEPLTTTLSADFIPSIDYQISRSGNGLQGGRYVGRGIGGDVVWSVLYDADIGWSEEDEDGLREMFDELKRNDDQPFLFIPQVTRASEPVVFARLGSDSLRFEDDSGLNRNVDAERKRRWTVTMPLSAVIR